MNLQIRVDTYCQWVRLVGRPNRTVKRPTSPALLRWNVMQHRPKLLLWPRQFAEMDVYFERTSPIRLPSLTCRCSLFKYLLCVVGKKAHIYTLRRSIREIFSLKSLSTSPLVGATGEEKREEKRRKCRISLISLLPCEMTNDVELCRCLRDRFLFIRVIDQLCSLSSQIKLANERQKEMHNWSEEQCGKQSRRTPLLMPSSCNSIVRKQSHLPEEIELKRGSGSIPFPPSERTMRGRTDESFAWRTLVIRKCWGGKTSRRTSSRTEIGTASITSVSPRFTGDKLTIVHSDVWTNARSYHLGNYCSANVRPSNYSNRSEISNNQCHWQTYGNAREKERNYLRMRTSCFSPTEWTWLSSFTDLPSLSQRKSDVWIPRKQSSGVPSSPSAAHPLSLRVTICKREKIFTNLRRHNLSSAELRHETKILLSECKDN